MKNYFLVTLYYLLFAIGNFIVFAYDIQNGSDFWTWIYLLNSILFFTLSILILLLEVIRELRESKK